MSDFIHAPADRIAKRLAGPLEVFGHRDRIARLYNQLDPDQQALAIGLVESLPRLVHQLARHGALAIPELENRAATVSRGSL